MKKLVEDDKVHDRRTSRNNTRNWNLRHRKSPRKTNLRTGRDTSGDRSKGGKFRKARGSRTMRLRSSRTN